MGDVTDGIFFESEKGDWSAFRKRFKKIIRRPIPNTKKNFRLYTFHVKDRKMFTGSDADSNTWKKLSRSSMQTTNGHKPTRLSWRQCAAIQGFPKNYPFQEGMPISALYRMIGNAVPPPVMQRIAENILPYFSGKKTSPPERSVKPEPVQEKIDTYLLNQS